MKKQNRRPPQEHTAIYLFVEGESDKVYFDTLKTELHIPDFKGV